MTKGRAALPCTAAKQTLGREEGGVFASAYLATTIYGSVTLPFVIPRGCDFIDSGAAVSFCPSDLTAPNKSHRPPLCHPERSRGICGAPRLPLKGLGFVSSHTLFSPMRTPNFATSTTAGTSRRSHVLHQGTTFSRAVNMRRMRPLDPEYGFSVIPGEFLC